LIGQCDVLLDLRTTPESDSSAACMSGVRPLAKLAGIISTGMAFIFKIA
jgi:hypothetical protein